MLALCSIAEPVVVLLLFSLYSFVIRKREFSNGIMALIMHGSASVQYCCMSSPPSSPAGKDLSLGETNSDIVFCSRLVLGEISGIEKGVGLTIHQD